MYHRADYGAAFTQPKGELRTPYVLADPPCVPPPGPDVTCASQKSYLSVEATQPPRAVIGRLTKTPTQNHKRFCVVVA